MLGRFLIVGQAFLVHFLDFFGEIFDAFLRGRAFVPALAAVQFVLQAADFFPQGRHVLLQGGEALLDAVEAFGQGPVPFLGLLAFGGGGRRILLGWQPRVRHEGRQQREDEKFPFHGRTIGTAASRGKCAVIHLLKFGWE